MALESGADDCDMVYCTYCSPGFGRRNAPHAARQIGVPRGHGDHDGNASDDEGHLLLMPKRHHMPPLPFHGRRGATLDQPDMIDLMRNRVRSRARRKAYSVVVLTWIAITVALIVASRLTWFV